MALLGYGSISSWGIVMNRWGVVCDTRPGGGVKSVFCVVLEEWDTVLFVQVMFEVDVLSVLVFSKVDEVMLPADTSCRCKEANVVCISDKLVWSTDGGGGEGEECDDDPWFWLVLFISNALLFFLVFFCSLNSSRMRTFSSVPKEGCVMYNLYNSISMCMRVWPKTRISSYLPICPTQWVISTTPFPFCLFSAAIQCWR